MNNEYFLEFQEEIKQITDCGNLEGATIRLMDFTKEFSMLEIHSKEALSIREDLSLVPLKDRNFDGAQAYQPIRMQAAGRVFDLLKKIEAEINKVNSRSGYLKEESAGIGSFEKKIFDPPPQADKVVQTVLQARDLTKRFEKFTLEGINLTCVAGEILAVIGENGSGKTTLLNMLAGEIPPTEGQVEYGFAHSGNWYLKKQYIAYLNRGPQNKNSNTLEYLKFLAAIHGHSAGFARYILYRMRLEKYVDASPEELSDGYKTRFELAKILTREPRLLILDEPLAHLDINSQQILLKDLRDFSKSQKHPMTIIVSSQHVYEIESLADKILFLENGKTLYYGKKEDINRNRFYNTFEVECDCDNLTLLKILTGFNNLIKITEWGTYLVINTPLSIQAMDVLKIFARNNLSVLYFRNVSNSTRMHFY